VRPRHSLVDQSHDGDELWDPTLRTCIAIAAVVEAALPPSSPTLPPETPPVQVATASTPDPGQNDAQEAVRSIETLDECLVADICIDQYLWSVYQRTPKLDTIKVHEQRKVTVKKNGKTRTVTKSFTKLVDEDFTWKDPNAAEKAGMPLMDYVIGGMDRSFKLKLYHALRVLDDAGLAPGGANRHRSFLISFSRIPRPMGANKIK
jgi:hypothetical protein